MKIPRLLIAATKSGSGKTTITAGLIKALQKRGLNVASYKTGPDYIDTTYHTRASRTPCRNLDSWLMPKTNLLKLFARGFAGKGIAVIEGAMGLFDGQASSSVGSSAHLAKMLKTPVVLIIDASSMGLSCQALAYGFKNFDSEINIAGVILNKVSSPRHLEILKKALKNSRLPSIGYLFKDKDIVFSKRHLGLLIASEVNKLDEKIDKIATQIEHNFDLNRLLGQANQAQELNISINNSTKIKPSVRIGVAKDNAFNFYYQDNLDLLEQAGAKIIYFSPLRDTKLPAVNGLYFGGGYPELYAEKLASNKKLKKEVKEAIESKMPVYAECGGYVYLSKKVITENGSFNFVNAFNTVVTMQPSFVSLGYAKAKALKANILSKKNTNLKGHMFHYSRTNYPKQNSYAYVLSGGEKAGSIYKKTLGSYLHLHFGSDFSLAGNFVASCKEFS